MVQSTPTHWESTLIRNVTVNLGGQYTTFQSEIGVPGSSSSSSVIFQIYGDGKLLYQSPVMTSASGTIPVNLNVAGVQQLSLDVIGSTNNTARRLCRLG